MKKQLVLLASFVVTTSLFSMEEAFLLRRRIEIAKIRKEEAVKAKASATIEIILCEQRLRELQNFHNSSQAVNEKGKSIHYSREYYEYNDKNPKSKL